MRATIAALRQPSVSAGHAAGWIGVGGPGAGPNGETMWLQTGVAALPGTPLMVYAEITAPAAHPSFSRSARTSPSARATGSQCSR